jgi:hypothetical protein
MIDLKFSISNPFSNRWDTLFFRNGTLPKHKAWEFNGYRTNQIINLEFGVTFKGDHAGLKTMVGLFGFNLELSIYDTRHWNYEKNRFYEPGEDVWPEIYPDEG